MKYFEVKMESPQYCGFDSYWWIKAESEEDVEKTDEYYHAMDAMVDYLMGWKEEEDSDDSTDPYVSMEEVTEEVYLDCVGSGGTG